MSQTTLHWAIERLPKNSTVKPIQYRFETITGNWWECKNWRQPDESDEHLSDEMKVKWWPTLSQAEERVGILRQSDVGDTPYNYISPYNYVPFGRLTHPDAFTVYVHGNERTTPEIIEEKYEPSIKVWAGPDMSFWLGCETPGETKAAELLIKTIRKYTNEDVAILGDGKSDVFRAYRRLPSNLRRTVNHYEIAWYPEYQYPENMRGRNVFRRKENPRTRWDLYRDGEP